MHLQVIFTSFLSGMLSAMGFGSGTVLIVWLTSYLSYGQLTAQGVNLLFFIPCAAVSLFIFRKKGYIDIKAAMPIILGGITGIILSRSLPDIIPPMYLKKLFGAFVILIAVSRIIMLIKEKGAEA